MVTDNCTFYEKAAAYIIRITNNYTKNNPAVDDNFFEFGFIQTV